MSNTISSDYTFNIEQDLEKNYWIATENGLNKLHFDKRYTNPKFTVFYHDSQNPKSLKSNSILYTLNDSKNRFWVATQDGLHLYHKSDNSFDYFGKKEGLTNTFIYSILEDPQNNLWVTTNDGIFRFNTKAHIFTNFGIKDGVQSTEFNLGAQFYDAKKGLLYFGGVNGYNYFNPKDVDRLDKEGSLVFTSLKIKGHDVTPFNDKKILTTNISKATSIHLNFDDFPCTLSFSELDLRKSKNNQFVYKLLPKNSDWNDLEGRNEIQLLDLSKGEYTLIIQGKSRNTLWFKKPLKLDIIVSPPWYQSNLAYLLYILLISSVLFTLYRLQLSKNTEHQEALRLKELNDLKNKLFTNITHEFRTPITVILGMSSVLKDKLKATKLKNDQSLEMINRNSKNLLNLVNQMLDLAKLEKGKLHLHLTQDDIIWHLKYLTESLSSYATDKNVSLIFYSEEESVVMDYDEDKMTQILTNLISNAIKFYEENDKIVVHVNKLNANLVIKVKDSGVGISETDLPFIYDRFYQAKNKINESSGSGIGLAFTKELIHLMKGSIEVSSELNKGTTFVVKLPIHNSAQKKIKRDISVVTTKTNQEEIALSKNLPIALIVEDNEDVATYIELCIKDNYQILKASNGKVGVEKAIKYIPDIIISDVMMPKKTGFELCKTLKEHVNTNHVPIILLTAKAAQEDKISGLTIGADAYLTKPFHKEELLIRIQKLIALRKVLQQKYQGTLKPVEKPKTTNDTFINTLLEKIYANIDDPDFNSLALSKAVYLSESQLYRKLKALTNTSTAIFIRKVRLDKAKNLLETTELSVSEVAYATGFSNPSWFSKTFKDAFGSAPNSFKS